MPDLESLTPDQRLALKTAATNLREHFAGTYSQDTIELFVETSSDQFASRARFTHFLPLTAERFARQRLTALARVEGKHDDGLPIVLFLCVHNAGRSQMALGWFDHLADGRAIGWSGGSDPGMEINEAVVEAMREIGIDIHGEFPKPGPTRSSERPTWSSPWDAATPAPSSPASATRTGTSMTPPVGPSTLSAPSGTRSATACVTCC